MAPYRSKVVTQRLDGLDLIRRERYRGRLVRVPFGLKSLQGCEFFVPALLQYLGYQTVGGVHLVILVKGALRFVLHLLYLALQCGLLITGAVVELLDGNETGLEAVR